MERNTVQWTISIPPPLSKKAIKVARQEYRTRSELIREALRRYLENRALDSIRAKISRRFKQMGVRTQEDIENLVDQGR